MEKFTHRTECRFGKRLLKGFFRIFFDSERKFLFRPSLVLFFFVIFCGNIFAANPYADLKFTMEENQLLMTDNDIKFTLIVPSALSKNVTLRFQEFGKNVQCTQFKKNDFRDDDGKKSTLIEFSLSFSKKGFYQLKPALVTVSRRSYSVKFDEFEIRENPYNLLPKMTVAISDSRGKKIRQLEFSNEEVTVDTLSLLKNEPYRFSVYVQNLSSVDNFVWEIPHNSIFSVTKDWVKSAEEINLQTAKLGENKKITPEILQQDFEKKFLLAEFQWTLLSAKDNEFPHLEMAYHSFYGYRNVIEAKRIGIEIKNPSNRNKNSNNIEENENSIIFKDAFSIEKENPENQNELSLEECENLVKSERNKLNLFNKISRKKYGIILKTDLYSIPEESAERIQQISGGIKVEIKEDTENWLFIESLGEEKKSGWCKKEKVLPIN